MPADQLAGLRARLAPRGETAAVLAHAALDPDQLRRVAEQVGPAPAAWAVEEAAAALQLVIDTFAHLPGLPLTEIAVSLETLMLNLVAGLAPAPGPGVSLSFMTPMAREAARRDVAFAEIIASMREVQGRSLARLLALAAGEAPAAVADVAAAVTQAFDAAVTRFVETYLVEREALLESQAARHRALVEALIGGEAVAAGEVRAELGIDLAAFHTGLVLTSWGGAADRDVPRLGRALRHAVPEASLLLLPAGRRWIWGWISTAAEPGGGALRRVARAAGGLAGLRCAIGSPAPGAGGFRQTHFQARDLDSWSRMVREASGRELTESGADRRVVTWSSHALPAVLSRDPERAKWFVAEVLGPLAETTRTAEEHRLTLQAYLDSGHSLQRAAQLRSVHRNTIVYRLQRIERLLGHPAGELELEVRSALLLARDLGVLVLRPPNPLYPDTAPEPDSGPPSQ
jgi:hypothetical protein